MKLGYSVKQIGTNWFLTTRNGKAYFSGRPFNSESEAKVEAVKETARDLQERMDILHNWLRLNDPDFNQSDEKGYLA